MNSNITTESDVGPGENAGGGFESEPFSRNIRHFFFLLFNSPRTCTTTEYQVPCEHFFIFSSPPFSKTRSPLAKGAYQVIYYQTGFSNFQELSRFINISGAHRCIGYIGYDNNAISQSIIPSWTTYEYLFFIFYRKRRRKRRRRRRTFSLFGEQNCYFHRHKRQLRRPRPRLRYIIYYNGRILYYVCIAVGN